MKEEPSDKPKVRVVDEDQPAAAVVRLGSDGPVTRLGESRAEAGDPSVAKRLEVGRGKAAEPRTATVDEILDASHDTESPEVPLEEGWGGESKKWLVVPWGWFGVITLICVGFAGWSMRHLIRNRHVTELAVSRTIELMESDKRLTSEAEVLYRRVEERLRSYLASTTIDERLKHVRDAERVEPLMKGWYAERKFVSEKFIELETFRPVTIEQQPFWLVRAQTDLRMHSLLLEQTTGDQVMVDWETDVCFQPMSWDRYVADRPEGPFDFRVEVKPDNFYAHEFADEGKFRSLRLGVRGSEEYLFGYVERGSAEERRILPLLRGSGRKAPMILRLQVNPDSASRRGVAITEVLSVRWCLVEGPPG